MFAVYFPKAGRLEVELAVVGFAFLVMVALGAGCKLRLQILIPAMLLGSLFAMAPALLSLSHADLRHDGDLYRRLNDSNHSDLYFALTAYFEVGSGKLTALAGMVLPFLVVLVCRRRGQRSAAGSVTVEPSQGI